MLAEIVVVPAAIPLADPFVSTVATEGLEEFHSAWLVMLITEPSLKVPFAVKAWPAPTLMLALPGVMLIEFRVALFTVRVAVPTCPLNTAEIVTAPGWIPVARPILPDELLMVAIEEEDEVHVTALVRSWLFPSAN